MRRQNILSWVKSQEVVIAILYHTTDNLSMNLQIQLNLFCCFSNVPNP